ncbi:MAG: GTP-binding protein [Phycisphaerales bacterium]|nr:MAG: GTP-binding protein [Phycisphaerales bacterium]
MDTHRVQLLTPGGAGAIGVLRMSGPRADRLLERAFQPVSGGALATVEAGSVRYGRIVAAGELIDDVLVCVVCREPDTVLELTCHGGVRVVERLIEMLGDLGFRFCADVPDLWSAAAATPVERAITAALGRARTERSVRFLAAQRSRLPDRVREALTLLRDDPSSGRAALEALIAHAESARRLVDGARVVLAGPPNAGKSTLFNRLVGRGAAIACHLAGTTRDWVRADVEIDGFPVTLYDTAGVYEEAEGLDRAAIAAGLSQLNSADLVIAVFDGGAGDVFPQAQPLLRHLPDVPLVACLNKSDQWDRPPPPRIGDLPAVSVSARTGDGLSALVAAVMGRLLDRGFRPDEPCLFSPEHVNAVRDALSDRRISGKAAVVLAETLLGRVFT